MPKPRSIAAVVATQSDSLTRSSSAWHNRGASAATAARIGISSIARTVRSPRSRSRAAHRRRPGSRPGRQSARRRPRARPGARQRVHRGQHIEEAGAGRVHADVGARDVVSSRRGSRRSAGTPTTTNSPARRSRRSRGGHPSRSDQGTDLAPVDRERRAHVAQEPLGVIAAGPGLDQARAAVGRQRREQQRGLDLRRRDRERVVEAAQATHDRPIVSGGTTSAPSPLPRTETAPIRASGSSTRRIGRLLSDSSPNSVVANGWPAARPVSSRIVAGVAAVNRRGRRAQRAGRPRRSRSRRRCARPARRAR